MKKVRNFIKSQNRITAIQLVDYVNKHPFIALAISDDVLKLASQIANKKIYV